MIEKVTLIEWSPHMNRLLSCLYESLNSIAKSQSAKTKKAKICSIEVEIYTFEIRVFPRRIYYEAFF